MFEIETKNLKISDELNRKIDIICRFACVKYEFIPGNIKSIKNTNIAYVKPHILTVLLILKFVHQPKLVNPH